MSYEINFRIGVKASPEEIYKTLTEPKKLAQWWTSDTRGSGAEVGDTLEFYFDNFCQKFEVTALKPGKHIAWKSPKGQGAGEWEGTEVSFDLSEDGKQTYVRFRHSGWKANTDFHAHCSMNWSVFMLSLKDLLETGKGRPFPNDIPINHR